MKAILKDKQLKHSFIEEKSGKELTSFKFQPCAACASPAHSTVQHLILSGSPRRLIEDVFLARSIVRLGLPDLGAFFVLALVLAAFSASKG